ncbi:hypothetical protein NDU88_005472 [Pleurodeles waltl]|uniref:Uncharacterized protein n=1 Tax=Pleurodeles waltl TaxID=8319 RepID=A0AAV7UK88_PLEWA|nr:hypothetical protein NDU88_005472 [Pleurodeles waltl]
MRPAAPQADGRISESAVASPLVPERPRGFRGPPYTGAGARHPEGVRPSLTSGPGPCYFTVKALVRITQRRFFLPAQPRGGGASALPCPAGVFGVPHPPAWIPAAAPHAGPQQCKSARAEPHSPPLRSSNSLLRLRAGAQVRVSTAGDAICSGPGLGLRQSWAAEQRRRTAVSETSRSQHSPPGPRRISSRLEQRVGRVILWVFFGCAPLRSAHRNRAHIGQLGLQPPCWSQGRPNFERPSVHRRLGLNSFFGSADRRTPWDSQECEAELGIAFILGI